MSVSRIIVAGNPGQSAHLAGYLEDYEAVKRLRQSLFNATRHTGRGARFLVLGVILGGAFLLVKPSLPAAARVSFALPPALRALDLEYEQGGAVVRAVHFGWADGGPELLRHEPELTPGPCRITATLRDGEGRTWKVRRAVAVEGDALHRIDLRAPPGGHR
jgi:hypothetical protein